MTVVAALATGCSSAAEPAALPTVEPPAAPSTPSVAASPTPSAETVPAPTKAATPGTPEDEAVLSAIDGYFAAANAASRGERLEDFRSLFSESCGICITQYDNFSKAYSDGMVAEGDLYTDWDARVEAVTDGIALVLTTVNTGEITLRDERGNTIEEFAPETAITTAWTLQEVTKGSWLIVDARDLG